MSVRTNPGLFKKLRLLFLGGKYSPEAEDVFDKMPNTLTPAEKYCIDNFISAEMSAGNWHRYDSFFWFAMLDPLNARTSWVGTHTATEVGAPIHAGGVAYSFDGASYLDLGYAPSAGVNFSLNDALFGVGVVDSNRGAVDDMSYGGVLEGGNRVDIREMTDGYRAGINDDGAVTFLSKQLKADDRGVNITRVNNTFKNLYIDGVIQPEITSVSNAIPLGNIFAGALNNAGVAQDHLTGTLAAIYTGNAVGFNNALQNSHMRDMFICFRDLSLTLRFPQPLEDFEEIAINTFIRNERLAGNWGKYDEFYCFPLTHPENALHGWFSKEATNNGATHVPGIGFDFNGTNAWLDSNFNPAADGENYKLDDAIMGAFLLNSPNPVSSFIAGSSDGTNILAIQLRKDAGERVDVRLNSGATATYENVGASRDNTLNLVSRIDAAGSSVFTNGVGANDAAPSDAIADMNIGIATRNNQGIPDNFFEGTLSTFITGGGIGFNHFSHHQNLILLLNDLNVFGNDVVNSFPNPLTIEEEEYVKDFVREQVISGNWFRIDSFSHFGLQDPVNAIWDWKRKVAMVNNGAVHSAGVGFDFDGVSAWIDSNLNTFTAGFKPKTGFAGTYVVINNSAGLDTWLFGADNNIEASFFGINNRNNLTRIQGGIFANNLAFGFGLSVGEDELLFISRENVNTTYLYKNGVQIASATDVEERQPPDINVAIGCKQRIDGLVSSYFNGTLSSFIAGAAINFNHLSYYQDLLTLNYKLELDSIIASAPNPLLADEELYLRDFIYSQMVAGNWHKMDSWAHFGLQDPVNAIWDWKRKVAMTNNGAIHQAGVGFEFDGSSYIDSNYNPTIDGNSFASESAIMGGFVASAPPGVNNMLYGAYLGGGGLSQFFDDTSSLRGNVANGSTISDPDYIKFQSDTLYVISVYTSSAFYRNGVSVATGVQGFTSASNLNIFIGARNNNGNPDVHMTNGTLSSFIAGAAINFNHLSYYQELLTLNYKLELDTIIASAPNPLLADEEIYLRDFIYSQMVAGNWHKMDSWAHFGLQDPVNALWCWKREVSMTNNSAVHLAGVGMEFDGVSAFLDSNYNPAVDGVNYQQNNALIGAFVGNDNAEDYNGITGTQNTDATGSWISLLGDAFVYEIETTAINEEVSLPMDSTSDSLYDFTVEYGDGSSDTITSYNDAGRLHTYAAIGVYEVRITGLFDYIKFQDSPASLIRVINWGVGKIGGRSFYQCVNLEYIICGDTPNFNGTSLLLAFDSCNKLISINKIGSWDVSNIITFKNLFVACWELEMNINSWNVSSATNMDYIFFACYKFNTPLNNWDISNVNSMYGSFINTKIFNQDLSSWNTSKVTRMNSLFSGALLFNQDLSSWNITSLTDAANILSSTSLSTANYDALLIGWEAQAYRPNVPLGVSTTKYTAGGAAEAARTALIANGWTITDGGPV